MVFNRVGSPYYRILKDSLLKVEGQVMALCPTTAGCPCLGATRTHNQEFAGEPWGKVIRRAAGLIEKHVDLSGLACRMDPAGAGRAARALKAPVRLKPVVKIAVALDNAFCFYYEENLEMLRGFGAELEYFSPMKDRSLPKGIGGLYLGGGYPELHAKALESYRRIRDGILHMAKKGLPIFAECGGLMYLGRSIEATPGARYSMAGVFPWRSRMLKKRKALGYREVTVARDCPVAKEGWAVRGHEFHYSEISRPPSGVKDSFSTAMKRCAVPL